MLGTMAFCGNAIRALTPYTNRHKRHREVKVTKKVIFGDSEKVENILAASAVSNKNQYILC